MTGQKRAIESSKKRPGKMGEREDGWDIGRGKEGEQEDGIWCGGGRGRPQADPVAYEIRKASLPPSGLRRCGNVVKEHSLSQSVRTP